MDTARTRVVRATLAPALGVAVLSTTTPGYAAWQEAHAVRAPGTAGSGRLAIAAEPARILHIPRDAEGRPAAPVDITANPAAARLTVGDALRVELPVTLHVPADSPGALLRVVVPPATGDRALAAELAAPANAPALAVTPRDGGPELAVDPRDRAARVVSAASDGRAYTIAWTTTTRPTKDGRARDATGTNWWGAGPASLQGTTVGPRSLTVTLTTTPTTTPTPTPMTTTTPTTATTTTPTTTTTATTATTATATPATAGPAGRATTPGGRS